MTGATVIPAFFDRLGAGEEPWVLLTIDPDRYIYESVRYGADEPLPEEIAVGIDDPDHRAAWSEKAPGSHGLPGETWWETIDRHRYYRELQTKLESGEIGDVNAAIAANLDLRTLVDDYLRMLAPIEAVEHAYEVLSDLSILDPTCGSGAFLFAALELLEDLYEALLDRAEELATADRRAVFAEDVRFHPNRAYFILKTALLNNLYGVDIMHEAGEISRLRLFPSNSSRNSTGRKSSNPSLTSTSTSEQGTCLLGLLIRTTPKQGLAWTYSDSPNSTMWSTPPMRPPRSTSSS